MADPIFVVAAPRSGGSWLAATLGRTTNVALAPAAIEGVINSRLGAVDRLTAADATPAVAAELRDAVAKVSGERRLLDISSSAALRVPFLHEVFPRATFVYCFRDPRRAIHEMLGGAPVEELARLWNAQTTTLLDDLERLPPGSWMVTSFRHLADEPRAALDEIVRFLGLAWDGTLPEPPMTAEVPPPDVVAQLDSAGTITSGVAARARGLFAAPPARAALNRENAGEMMKEAAAAAFRSISTQSFPALLRRLGISLVVSTYQSGRLILLRAENATTLNTHFRLFHSPMGIAVGAGRLAIGTEREVWDYRNQPAVAAKLDPPGKHDACFVPRKIHVTGDIRIHEIAFAGKELWIVNTRFSALCTLDRDSSFVPRWRPPFITHLAAEDRCHLNGMAIEGDRIRYVTAFGTTDTAGGWRENKRSGGLLLEVPSGEVVLRGLSMPHSPRFHDGRFFFLESGRGTLATADLASGRVETIAELPGFTRGLAFAGPFAFVGLSQVRETNVFGGIQLTERVAERECAVYVIDTRNGQTVAFLRFEGDVREIFDVQVLPGMLYPELLELSSPLVATSYMVPDETLADFVVK